MPRIPGLSPEEADPEARRIFDQQEQRYGAVLYNHAVLARRPSIFRGFRAMWEGLDESGLLPSRLVGLLNIRVASLIGCGL